MNALNKFKLGNRVLHREPSTLINFAFGNCESNPGSVTWIPVWIATAALTPGQSDIVLGNTVYTDKYLRHPYPWDGYPVILIKTFPGGNELILENIYGIFDNPNGPGKEILARYSCEGPEPGVEWENSFGGSDGICEYYNFTVTKFDSAQGLILKFTNNNGGNHGGSLDITVNGGSAAGASITGQDDFQRTIAQGESVPFDVRVTLCARPPINQNPNCVSTRLNIMDYDDEVLGIASLGSCFDGF